MRFRPYLTILSKTTKHLLSLFKSPIFIAGLLIRIIIMPFAMHADLLSMYWRAHVMAQWNIWQAPFNQYLGHIIYALNLKFMQLIGFDLTEIFFVPFGLSVGSFTASPGDWLRFVEISNINKVLFFLKLPNLVFDIGVFALLAYWFMNSQLRHRILLFWWLNPVNIFAFYIFSRHDSITLFFILITMMAFARRNVGTMLLALFSAIQVRVQPLMLSPLFIVPYFSQLTAIKKHINGIAWSMLVIFGYWALLQFLPTNAMLLAQLRGLPEPGSTAVAVAGIPLSIATQTFGTTLFGIPIFYALYAIICLSLVGIAWGKRHQAFITLSGFVGLTMALYFAINPFSPHYFVWLSLSAAILSGLFPRVARWYTLAIFSWATMGVIGIGKYAIDQNLFLPFTPYLFGTPKISDLLYLNYGEMYSIPFSVSRVILSIMLFGMSFEIIKILTPNFSWKVFWDHELTRSIWKVLKRTPFSKILPAILLVLGLLISSPSITHAAKVPIIAVDKTDAQIQLNHGQPLGQVFKAPNNPFGIVEVRFNTARATKDEKIIFRLRKVGEGDWFYTSTYNAADFYNGHYYPFGFPPIYDPGAYYRFELELLEVPEEGEIPIAVYTSDNRYSDGLMTFKGEPFTKHDLNFRVSIEVSSANLTPYVLSSLLTKLRNQLGFFIVYMTIVTGLFVLLLVQITPHLYRHQKNQKL